MQNATKLASALADTGYIEVLKKSESLGKVQLFYRVHQKRTWLTILEYMLARRSGWSEHICQQYFMNGGKLRFGWNFILSPENADLNVCVDNAIKLIQAGTQAIAQMATRHRYEPDTMPLMGASPRRTASISFDPRQPGPDKGGPSHKGAYVVGAG